LERFQSPSLGALQLLLPRYLSWILLCRSFRNKPLNIPDFFAGIEGWSNVVPRVPILNIPGVTRIVGTVKNPVAILSPKLL
jgi:hypothetical protein